MSDQRSFISADQFHPDPYTQSRNAERTLNAAIVHADISRSYEEYLGIFDEFYADDVDETHSAWTLELVGATGKVCTVSWRTFRKWNESRVVQEHHYDHQQNGDPLTHNDLRFDAPEAATGVQRPS